MKNQIHHWETPTNPLLSYQFANNLLTLGVRFLSNSLCLCNLVRQIGDNMVVVLNQQRNIHKCEVVLGDDDLALQELNLVASALVLGLHMLSASNI